MLKRLLDFIGPMWQLVLILAAVMTALVTFREYVATKTDLEIAKCEAADKIGRTRAELASVRADSDIERYSRTLETLVHAKATPHDTDLYRRAQADAEQRKRDADHNVEFFQDRIDNRVCDKDSSKK